MGRDLLTAAVCDMGSHPSTRTRAVHPDACLELAEVVGDVSGDV